MSADNPTAPYILVVLTDSYSGNFERGMCAYMTGIVGECGVGDDQAEIFKADMEEIGKDPDMFDGMLEWEPDDHGCHRPASIWNYGKNNGYNDVAIFFAELPDADQTVMLRDRAFEYGKKNKIKVKELKMIKRTITTVDEEVGI